MWIKKLAIFFSRSHLPFSPNGFLESKWCYLSAVLRRLYLGWITVYFIRTCELFWKKKSSYQYPPKYLWYNCLPSILQIVNEIPARNAEHCWWSKYDQWATFSNGILNMFTLKVRRPTKSHIYHLWADTASGRSKLLDSALFERLNVINSCMVNYSDEYFLALHRARTKQHLIALETLSILI